MPTIDRAGRKIFLGGCALKLMVFWAHHSIQSCWAHRRAHLLDHLDAPYKVPRRWPVIWQAIPPPPQTLPLMTDLVNSREASLRCHLFDLHAAAVHH